MAKVGNYRGPRGGELTWSLTHLQRKGVRHRKLSRWEQQGNRTRSRIRSRVEHVFGIQAQKATSMILRGIGIIRAKTKIGLRNLVYNFDRYGSLVATH